MFTFFFNTQNTKVRSYHNKRSAAGTIEDDDVVQQHQQQYNKVVTIQSSQSLLSLANGNSEQQLPSATAALKPQKVRFGFENDESRVRVNAAEGENLKNIGDGSSDDNLLPSEYWLLTFEEEGERPLVRVKVTKSMDVIADVISVIASVLGVDDERVSLVVANTASALHNLTPVTLLQHYYESDNPELNIASSHRPPISDFHFMDDDFTLNHAKQEQSNVISALTDVIFEGKTAHTATDSGDDAKVKAGGDNTTLLHEEEDTTTLPQQQQLSKSNTTLDDNDPHDAGMVLYSHMDDATTSSSDKAARDNPNRSSLLQQQQQRAMNNTDTLPSRSAECIVIGESKENNSHTEDYDDYSSILDSSGGDYDTMDDRSSSNNQIDFRANTPDFNKTEETDFSVPIDALKRADFYEIASGG